MDVTPNFVPTSEMRPARPEKMNIPSRYGSAVMMALKPLEYATPRTAHQAAAADDGRADGGHQNQRPEGAPAEIIIVHAPDLFDHHKADEHHCNQIRADDRQIQRVKFVVNHVCLLSFRQADTRRIMLFLFC